MGLALTRRGNIGPSGVGEHFAISDDSNANLVGTALKSDYDRHGTWEKYVKYTLIQNHFCLTALAELMFNENYDKNNN